jgi:hypothetical protein
MFAISTSGGDRFTLARDLKAKSGRPSRSDFASFVKTLPDPKKLLGLTHITSSYTLRDIIETGSIEAREPCPVMGELVTYAFYGRAAFRGGTEFKPTNLPCLFPSVLIMDPRKVPLPKYVFGFDSGAFVSGMMDRYLHPYMPLFDFLLAPEPSSAARLVQAIFETDEDYFRNRPSATFNVPASNFEADCYRRIVIALDSDLDDRASTPEIIFSNPIDVRKAVCAAVLPDTLARDPIIGGALKTFGVTIYDYPWTQASRPVENHFTVRNLVESAYRNLKWL